MSFSIGIVGLPNVGKSTLFKALTRKAVAVENFPFCTIDPNVGVVAVPDERLDKLAAISKSEKIIPTVIEFVDIAGLVAGAHKGEGLGNKFLSHIREVDAIAHVVRDFSDKNIIHVANRIDPKEDEAIIILELVMADLAIVEKKIKDAATAGRGHDKRAALALAAYEKIKALLNAGQPAAGANLNAEEKEATKETQLLTSKPMLNVLNVVEADVNRQPEKDNEIIVSAKIEAELSELEPAEAQTMLAELGLRESGLDKLITASYKLLDLITFFTSGPKETRAWTIKKGAAAPEAAGRIHTDFEKGFIRAEVISYDDFVSCGGEVKAKEKGLARLEGKEYIVQDGDVCHFRFSA